MSPGQKRLNDAARALSMAYRALEDAKRVMANAKMAGLGEAVATTKLAYSEFARATREVVIAEAALNSECPRHGARHGGGVAE